MKANVRDESVISPIEYSSIGSDFNKQDDYDFLYKCAVKYMALTELHDRCISDVRSSHDPTEAFLFTQTQRSDSSLYARSVLESMNIQDLDISPIIHAHCRCSAQWWIDEYHRIFDEDGEKY